MTEKMKPTKKLTLSEKVDLEKIENLVKMKEKR